MVTILPKFAPGEQFGSQLGQGIGQGLEKGLDRQVIQSGLDSLKNLDLENMSAGEVVNAAARGFLGKPGGAQFFETLLPTLLQEKRSVDYLKSLRDQEQGQQQIQGNGLVRESEINNVDESLGIGNNLLSRPDLAPTRQKVPGLEEGVPSYNPLTRKEKYEIAQSLIGQDPKFIQETIQQEEKRRKDNYDALVEAKKAKTKQFSEERALEEDQENKVNEYLSKELKVPVEQLDPYNSKKAYELFKKYQKEKPNSTDKQIWERARSDFNRMQNSFNEIENKITRPSFLDYDSKRKLEKARESVQSHLDKYGSFIQDREKLMTLMMQNGFNRTEASSIVWPQSSSLNDVIEKTKPISKIKTVPIAEIGDFKFEGHPKLTPYEQNTYLDNLSEKIAQNITKDDSLILLRDKLLREKGITEDLFEDVLKRVKDKMGSLNKTMSPYQDSEIPHLSEKVRPSLMDIFFGGQEFDLRKYYPQVAK